MPTWLYISRADALAAGLTHKGSLFGVPAWLAGEDGEVSMATPKIPALHAWCMLCDAVLELMSYFMPSDSILVSPITITGRI